jgi:predicted nucleic acid-binding protein
VLASESSASSVNTLLGELGATGVLVVSGCAYAELLAFPGAPEAFIAEFLAGSEVGIDFATDESIWRTAGQRYARYAERRRKSRGGHPKRFLTDFLIGAHALLRCDRLFTLDVERYRTDFPDVELISI